MRLKEEVKEAAAAEMRRQGYHDIAERIEGVKGCGYVAADAVAAALEVLDQYEEVEARVHKSGEWAYLPHDGRPAAYQTSPSYDTRTIYMRKQEPAPTVEELARRAVKAWHSDNDPFGETMAALEAALEK